MNRHTRITGCVGGLLVIFCLLSTSLMAQWNVSMFMQPLPSPYLSDWEHNPTIGSLTITNNTSSQTDVVVYLTIARNSSGVIATGSSSPITTQPNVPTQVNSDRFIDWNTVTYNAGMRDQAIQTGRLPEGEYNACVTVRDLSGTILASNVCAPFTIVYPNPPSLFFPADGDSLDSMNPLFTWTPVQVPPAYQLHYVLRIVEVLSGQTPHQALLANIAQYEDDNLLTTNVQYPISALPLEPGKTYAWQVQAVDQNGFPPSANQGRSEIWTFVAKDALQQTPTSPGVASPLFVSIVRTASGPFANLSSSSFENVSERLAPYNSTGGTVALPLPVAANVSSGQRDTLFSIEVSGGIHVDLQKRTWGVKGRLRGADMERLEVLLAGVWGSSMDVRKTILVLRRPSLLSDAFPNIFNGLTGGFLILSLGDFAFAPAELPDSLADFIAGADSTSASEFFGTEDEIDLKAGLNLLGKFDLRRAPWLTDLMTQWGVEDPHLKLAGFVSAKWEWAVSRSGGQTQNYQENTFGIDLTATIPVSRSRIAWLPELNAFLGIAWKTKTRTTGGPDSLEQKLTPKVGLTGKMTFPFLRSMNFLNDTIEVTGSIDLEFESLGRPDIVAKLEFDDIIKFERFEDVFRVHSPKIEWNISKSWRGEGGVRLKAAFDFAQVTNVGVVEVLFEKETDSSQVRLERRRAGVWPPTDPQGNPRQGGTWPATNPPSNPRHAGVWPSTNPEENRRHAGIWAATNPAPLTGAKPTSQWKPKVTARFDPVALASLTTSLVMRKALGDNIFGDAGTLDDALRVGRNSTPPPNYPPPEIPDFLNNIPSLEELSMSFRPGSLGSMVIRARTSYRSSSTEIIVARAESATKKGFLLGLKPQNWSIQNYFPNFSMPGLDNVTLSNVSLILSTVEGMMPSSELSDEEFEFYSAAYGSDEFMVVIKEGLNIIAAIPSDNLMNNSPLTPLLTKLGVQQGNILLQGSLGKRVNDIYLLGIFPSMQPEGSPEWFHSGQLAIELTGQPSVGLVCALAVDINGDIRDFFIKTKVGGEGLVLVGGMTAAGGWESPFGIQGLTLNKVVLLLGLTPAGSVQLGFEGDLVVGEKDMHTAVLVAISPAGVPTNFMFDGKSEAGFGVSDLVALQQKIAAARAAGTPAIPLDNVPPLYIKDAKLKFAPKDSPELGISRGMTVAGLLQLKPESGSTTKNLALANFDVGDDSIVARGNIADFTLGPVKLQGAELDLFLSMNNQHCILTGQADLGFMNTEIDLRLTKTIARFESQTRIFNAFDASVKANGALSLTQQTFTVQGKMKNDFHGAVAQQLRQAIKDILAANKASAKTAADDAERKWRNAVQAREAARERWADLPVLPRDPKVAARNTWESAIAKALSLRADKELKEGKERRWGLTNNLLAQLEQQAGQGNFVVVQSAEFDADLTKLKTGAVMRMALDVKVGDREFDLELNNWNFKNMGTSVKGAAKKIADNLFESFQ